jgi:hypothetical protein
LWRVWAGDGGPGESAFGGPVPPRAATVCATYGIRVFGVGSDSPLAIRRRRTTDSFGCGREPKVRGRAGFFVAFVVPPPAPRRAPQ